MDLTHQLCSSIVCEIYDTRVNVVRFAVEFNTTVVLHNLSSGDSGTYVAVADVRAPSNNMRTDTFKNFSLNIDHRGTVTCTDFMILCT